MKEALLLFLYEYIKILGKKIQDYALHIKVNRYLIIDSSVSFDLSLQQVNNSFLLRRSLIPILRIDCLNPFDACPYSFSHALPLLLFNYSLLALGNLF